MEPEKIVGFIALAWLIGSVLLMLRLIRRGQRLAAEFARRHPDAYQAAGQPRPALFQTLRGRRFAQFVAKREYDRLDDPSLAGKFKAYRHAEARLLLGLLLSLALVGLLILAVQYGVFGQSPAG